MLDELLASGEVCWSGAGSISAGDGWVAFHPADTASLTLAAPADIELTDTHRAVLEVLGRPGDSRGAFFFRQLAADGRDEAVKAALWELIWAGWITGDTFAPMRATLTGSRRAPAHRQRRAPRLSRHALARPQARPIDPAVAGRWSALPAAEPDSTARAGYTAELLMNRHGVLTKAAAVSEGVPGGFAVLYKVLSAFEEAGRCQRGYFVESLGGAQFALAATVDRLRTFADPVDAGAPPAYDAVVLAAADPANPYGAALPWPSRPDDGGHRPGRKAGALVVLVDGQLVWFLERGGRSLLTFRSDGEVQRVAAGAMAGMLEGGRVSGILVERIDGVPVLQVSGSAAGTVEALLGAGFTRTPRGLRMRSTTR